MILYIYALTCTCHMYFNMPFIIMHVYFEPVIDQFIYLYKIYYFTSYMYILLTIDYACKSKRCNHFLKGMW